MLWQKRQLGLCWRIKMCSLVRHKTSERPWYFRPTAYYKQRSSSSEVNVSILTSCFMSSTVRNWWRGKVRRWAPPASTSSCDDVTTSGMFASVTTGGCMLVKDRAGARSDKDALGSVTPPRFECSREEIQDNLEQQIELTPAVHDRMLMTGWITSED